MEGDEESDENFQQDEIEEDEELKPPEQRTAYVFNDLVSNVPVEPPEETEAAFYDLSSVRRVRQRRVAEAEAEGVVNPPPVRQRKVAEAALVNTWYKGSRIVKWVQWAMGRIRESESRDHDPALARDFLSALSDVVNQFSHQLLVRSIASSEVDPKVPRQRNKKHLSAIAPSSSSSSLGLQDKQDLVLVFSEPHVRAALQSMGMLEFVQAGSALLGQEVPELDLLSCRPLGPVKVNPAFLQPQDLAKPKPAKPKSTKPKSTKRKIGMSNQ